MKAYQFTSKLKEDLAQLLEQKHALGYPYVVSGQILAEFDRFCCRHFPDAETITPELAKAWAVIKPTEKPESFRNRMAPVRELARHMRRKGKEACVIPNGIVPRESQRHMPHIFTMEELAAFFHAADSQPVMPGSTLRHLQIPVIFRIMYACGLRPNEARLIRTADLSRDCGTLSIPESKGHKDRIVRLPDGLAGICRAYRGHLETRFPGSGFFFPCQRYGGRHYSAGWLTDAFHRCWEDAALGGGCGSRPRPYDLRHTFATHRLYQWMAEGKDLSVCLPYLSAYMGHADFSATAYYIHLVPEIFSEMSGMDRNRFEGLIPEVPHEDKR